MYYIDDDYQAFKIPATGGTATQLTFALPFIENPRVSGANGAVVMWGEDGALPGGDNPDGSPEIWVTDTSGNPLSGWVAYLRWPLQ